MANPIDPGVLQEVPWHRAVPTDGGRRLKVIWVSGLQPLERVALDERPDVVVITLSERHPPPVLPDGTETGILAVAITRCVEIGLEAPLGTRRLVDGSTGIEPERVPAGEDGYAADRALALGIDADRVGCEASPAGDVLDWSVGVDEPPASDDDDPPLIVRLFDAE
jgi:hypothetical protein